MTTTTRKAAGDSRVADHQSMMARGPGPAPLSSTASVATFGNLTWLGWVWGLAAVGFAVVMTAISRWGELDRSLWNEAVAGWQRWPLLAAGVMTAVTFAPMFIAHGVTRRRLASSSAIAMVVLSVLGGLFLGAGYVAERWVFRAQGWTHGFDPAADPTRLADLGLAAVHHGLILAAAFVTGWLIGIVYERLGTARLAVLFVPCLLPLVVVELLLRSDVSQFVGLLNRLDLLDLPGGVGVGAAGLVVALATVVASALTRTLEL